MAHPQQAAFDALADKWHAAEIIFMTLADAGKDAGMPERSINYFRDHVAEFSWLDGKLCHTASEKAARDWVMTDLRTKQPYLWEQYADRDLLRRAFLNGGNLTAQGQLHEAIGPRDFEIQKALWKNGEPEQHAVVAAETDKEIRDLEAQLATLRGSKPVVAPVGGNPWAEATWSASRQQDLARKDQARAAATAAAAGSFLGATRPGQKRLIPVAPLGRRDK